MAEDKTKIIIRNGRALRGSPMKVAPPGRPGQPGFDPNGPKKGYLDMLLDKQGDAILITALRGIADAALEDLFGSRRPQQVYTPLLDGDEKLADGSFRIKQPEARGKMIARLIFYENRLPPVLRRDKSLAVTADFNPGYWLGITGRAKAWTRSGNNGVSFYLNGAIILAEDDIIAGSDDPMGDLDDILGDVAATAGNASGASAGISNLL